MKFGFHISISGGLTKVVQRAITKECEIFQIFSRNPRGWHYSPLNQEDVVMFRRDIQKGNIDNVFIHLPYLPNLASDRSDLLETSRASLEEELRRADLLGIGFVLTHIGSRLNSSTYESTIRVIDSINRAFDNVSNNVVLLLENTAGEGTEIGDKFSVIRDIIDGIEYPERIGVCLDTAHAFQAGYDLSTERGVEDTIGEFSDIIGIDRLHLLHLNDSKTPLGSNRDLHWHIGEGYIGIDGFRCIVNHPLLSHLPGIMETPRSSDEDDQMNMKRIKALVVKSDI